MDPVIKQILPIPEGLTAMIRCETENGKKYYFDANASGGTVVYALVEDGFGGALEFYTTDCNGIGELQEHDEKMLADTISDYNACCEAGVDALLGKNTRDSQPWYRISRHGCHGRHNFHKYLLPKAGIRCFATTTGPRDLPFIREVTI